MRRLCAGAAAVVVLLQALLTFGAAPARAAGARALETAPVLLCLGSRESGDAPATHRSGAPHCLFCGEREGAPPALPPSALSIVLPLGEAPPSAAERARLAPPERAASAMRSRAPPAS